MMSIGLNSEYITSSENNSTANSSKNRKDLTRKLTGKTRNRETRGKDLRSNQGIPNYLRSCPKRSTFKNSKLEHHKRVIQNFQKIERKQKGRYEFERFEVRCL